eukprot:TRINITY_DN8053_c0_g1_i1.p2 TRINITY_DN8053_c0_g1~~TRINITY_DN8053_c0_g1_i1.p2  ORF type:complete len:123 (-),score=11.87 TRINITY_DN8053_c0_g1_i1:466-834(-)
MELLLLAADHSAAPKTQKRKRRLPDLWTPEEDALLREAMARSRVNAPPGQTHTRWREIAQQVPNRTADQCIQRWVRALDPSISKKRWQPHEDAALLHGVLALGERRWSAIARGLPGRTDMQV